MTRHRGTFQYWPHVWHLWRQRRTLDYYLTTPIYQDASPGEVDKYCSRRQHG